MKIIAKAINEGYNRNLKMYVVYTARLAHIRPVIVGIFTLLSPRDLLSPLATDIILLLVKKIPAFSSNDRNGRRIPRWK